MRWHACGSTYQGVLVIKRGDVAADWGCCAGIGKLEETGLALRFLTVLIAEALGHSGQVSQGLAVVEEAIGSSERSRERWVTAELLRIKGELLLLQGAPGAAAAEDHFRQGLALAHQQGALTWELRAAASIAQLLRDQGRSADALALLQPVYDGFTEGFGTADLVAAKRQLDELNGAARE